jgi:flavorubredoxin
VKADEVIDLGGRTITFMPMPMVHWPDSMFTYCPEERVLMPNDAFGQHVASEERFADELGLDESLTQLGIYYANILLPLGTAVGKAIDKVLEKGWPLDVVAPSHGVMWRGEDFGHVVERYRRWGSGELRNKAVVIYSTMWGSTETLAQSVAEGISAGGAEVEMHDLAVTPLAHITYDILESKAVVLGSPTLHHGMLYRMAGYLQYLGALKPENRIAGVFGSYGWSKGAEKQMRARLEEIGIEVVVDDFLVKFRPTADDRAAAEAWGREIAGAITAR